MQALKALVYGMGVLIVIGTAVVISTIVHRISAPHTGPIGDITLSEPAGTHIVSASSVSGVVTLVLSGGGADRVAVIDMASGKTLGQLRLAPRN
jgi:hypothetical protein